jgi:sec-independent protein translocase protein TatC
MGLVTRAWLVDKRLYFWGAFLGIAFLFSPDPTGMAPIMVAATMIGLFEGTLGVLSWTGEGSITPGPEEIAGLRPLVWLLVGLGGYLASPAAAPSGYYDALPAAFTGLLEAAGAAGLASVLVGVGLAALFEAFVRLLRRADAPIRLRAAVARLRVPAWLVAAGAGYLANPNPALVDRVDVSLLGPREAAALVAVLLVVYEGGLAVWGYRRVDR